MPAACKYAASKTLYKKIKNAPKRVNFSVENLPVSGAFRFFSKEPVISEQNFLPYLDDICKFCKVPSHLEQNFLTSKARCSWSIDR